MTSTPADVVQFPAPTSAASLYVGQVMHARMKPVTHRFTYNVFSLLIDLDRLEDAGKQSAVFSIERFNLLAFSQSDHGPRDGTSLRAHVDGLLARAGLNVSGGRVLLLCYPRILGFTFNPLSVFWCYDRKGDLAALVYEVHNTFGQAHSYVAPIVADEEASAAGIRQERDKLFYVSPFMDMDMRYRFRLLPPGDKLSVRILESDAEGPILAATFAGRRVPFTTPSLLKAFFKLPLLTLKIVAAIHWEALRLAIKGLRLKPRPLPPEPASFIRPPADPRWPLTRKVTHTS